MRHICHDKHPEMTLHITLWRIVVVFFISLGAPILNLKKMWEKLLLAARVIAAIENPADIIVLSNKPFGQVRIQVTFP